MADYWKSQEKKYCDFCKCWIADNKPSVEFHEKGRRHKENVAKRLKAIQKKSKHEERQNVRMDAALAHMELAALEAYSKDVANNADLTSMAINQKVQDNLADTKKLWRETKLPSGLTYYWNIMTNEKVWEPPSEGYMSVAEQREAAESETRKQLKAVQRHHKIQSRARAEEERKEQQEEQARINREKMKARRAEDLPAVTYAPIIPPGKSTPYGQWQVVRTVEQLPVLDLQLPPQPYYEPVIPEPEPEPIPQPLEFKEKVVESLGSSTVSFKRRKIAGKQNARQRAEDD